MVYAKENLETINKIKKLRDKEQEKSRKIMNFKLTPEPIDPAV